MTGKKYIIGILLLCLALTIIGSCKTSTYEMAHKMEPPRYDAGFVIDNPAQVGQTIEKLIDLSVSAGEDMPTEESMHHIYVTVQEVYTGDAAWERLQQVEGNEPPSEGYYYILAKVNIKLEAAASSSRWFNYFEFITDRSQFVAYSPDHTRYAHANVMPPDPVMRYHMVTGDEKWGWLAFMVPESDNSPRMQITKENTNLWFELFSRG